MEKSRQKYLFQWLRSQQKAIRNLLIRNILLATCSSFILVIQTFLLAFLLHQFVLENTKPQELTPHFLGLLACFTVRGLILWQREKIGFTSGQQLRQHIRRQIFEKIRLVGAIHIQGKPAGSWASLILEQVENLHNFYARYLPQQMLSIITPIIILIVIFPINWVAGLILIITAPLVPVFMILVGLASADNSQKNMATLARLSNQFLDRLIGLETLRLFNQAISQTQKIEQRTEDYRYSTMNVLRMAFLSSAVLEFFTSISIAIMAVYFGFSFLGQIEFGAYGSAGTLPTLFAGFFCLILAPEFYQPLRDLGTYYHDRSAAIGAADSIVEFLEQPHFIQQENPSLNLSNEIHIQGENLIILSPQGKALSQPLNFSLSWQSHTAIVGQSGAGKTSLISVLLGFLPYQGSLKINDIELSQIQPEQWRKYIAWVGQNPRLLQGTLRENILLGKGNIDDIQIQQALYLANAKEFTDKTGLDFKIQEGGIGLSVGQAQRIAIARALLQQGSLLILDEPTASLDAKSEQVVLNAIQQISRKQTTLMITHRIEDLQQCDQILVMKEGKIIQQGQFDELKKQGYFQTLLENRLQTVNSF